MVNSIFVPFLRMKDYRTWCTSVQYRYVSSQCYLVYFMDHPRSNWLQISRNTFHRQIIVNDSFRVIPSHSLRMIVSDDPTHCWVNWSRYHTMMSFNNLCLLTVEKSKKMWIKFIFHKNTTRQMSNFDRTMGLWDSYFIIAAFLAIPFYLTWRSGKLLIRVAFILAGNL